MAASATITATLPPQQGAFSAAPAAMTALPPQQGASFAAAPAATTTLPPQQGASFAAATAAAAVPANGHHAAAAPAEAASTLKATSTPETTETANTAATATADVSAVLDAQVRSDAVSSTLMGIALLAYLQGSAAKHEASGAGGRGSSAAAPSSSQRGGAGARPVAAASHPCERLPPRRYQRMSPVDVDAPIDPLTRTLAGIKASQSKAQYTCKRVLSSSTYLHRVHVNAAMSNNLLPDYGGHTSGSSSPRDDDENARRAPTGAPTCRKPNTVIFRRRVRMLDERDREWLITYESLCSAGQRHTRFSAGWATLCKANDFKVGETIVFSRWGKRDSGVVVVARENCAL